MPETAHEGGDATGDNSHVRKLTILNAIAEALNSSPDEQQALDRTLALVADLLGLRTGWIWLREKDSGQFYSAAARNLPPYLQTPERMTGHSCNCIGEFNSGALTPRNIDLIECSRLRPGVLQQATDLTEGLAYHASIPLYFRDQPLGILNVTGPSWRRLTEEELQLLSTIAYQVGIAIERARLAEDSTRLARSEERTRIAREIHDTLAQDLTAIALQVESALKHLTSDPQRAQQRLERALTTTRDSLEEARRSVQDLRAAPLAGKPLEAALRSMTRSFTSETGIPVRLALLTDRQLPLRVEAELYRISQEALANVRQHAQASKVELTLQFRPERVRLAVRDDGVGFDLGSIGQDQHGLTGMRERARLLDGRLWVRRCNPGTLIMAAVPLEDASDA